MIIYQKASVVLVYDQTKHQLVQKWNGFSSSDVFREAIDKTLKFVQVNRVKSILSDTLNQAVVKPEDTQYAASIMPSLFTNGVKAMAFVMPKDVLTQMSLKKFDGESKSDNVKMFSNEPEAQKWLDSRAN